MRARGGAITTRHERAKRAIGTKDPGRIDPHVLPIHSGIHRAADINPQERVSGPRDRHKLYNGSGLHRQICAHA